MNKELAPSILELLSIIAIYMMFGLAMTILVEFDGILSWIAFGLFFIAGLTVLKLGWKFRLDEVKKK